jgi:hypothetical protein
MNKRFSVECPSPTDVSQGRLSKFKKNLERTNCLLSSHYLLSFRYYTDHTENTASNFSSIVSCAFVSTGTSLPNRCLSQLGGTQRHLDIPTARWSHKPPFSFQNKKISVKTRCFSKFSPAVSNTRTRYVAVQICCLLLPWERWQIYWRDRFIIYLWLSWCTRTREQLHCFPLHYVWSTWRDNRRQVCIFPKCDLPA